MRAIGCSRAQVLGVIMTEALLLTSIGSLAGIVLGMIAGSGVEHFVKQFVPLSPAEPLLWPTPSILVQCLAVGVAAGLSGSIYPAWRASRLHPAEALKAEI